MIGRSYSRICGPEIHCEVLGWLAGFHIDELEVEINFDSLLRFSNVFPDLIAGNIYGR
jgi:hypothetical protein